MTKDKKKDISVVIPTALEDPEYLWKALHSLEKNTVQDYELIVVLNGDLPRAKEVAEMFDATTIQLEENTGYGGGMNAGFERASADYIVGSNDDVLFTPEWDLHLRQALDTFHKRQPYPRAGIVGPCTNFAGGVQQVQIPGLTEGNVDEVAVQFSKENSKNLVCTGFVSGFFFMVTRKFYNDMVSRDGHFFDHETYPLGGAEDNDLCVRATRAGWSSVVAGTCFVYHFGSKTLKKVAPDSGRGVANLFNLYKKWEVEEDQILGALYRVKMMKGFHKEDWLRSLEQTYKFCDRIYIFDDQSDKDYWPTEEELAPFKDKIREIVHNKKKQMESDDRQQLYEMAREDGCDWVISVDHDEIFEDKFDRDYAQRLMKNPNPQVCGYIFHWYHLWNSEDYWRSDGNRGNFKGMRMCRVLPKFYIPRREFHVGNVPNIPQHTYCITSVRVKHLGQMRQEDRARKYDFYEKHDKVKDPKLIGNEDYSHVVDETHATIEPWIEENGISMTTIMKNEEIALHHYMNQYWAFADEMVLVDTGSEDKSVELAELWGVKVIETEWEDNFSKARNLGLKHCTKEWIFQVDIDEDCPEISKIRRMMEWQAPDGFLFYINNFLPSGKSALSETVRLFRNTGEWHYSGLVHETVDDYVEKSGAKLYRAETGLNHRGFLSEKGKMKSKLANYLRMNIRQILKRPDDSRAYYNAAMHFKEAGYEEAAKYLLERSAQLNKRFIQPYMELGMHHLEQAAGCYSHLVNILPEHHVMRGKYQQALNQIAPLVEERDPIDQSHVAEVLQEEEFRDFAQVLARKAEGGV